MSGNHEISEARTWAADHAAFERAETVRDLPWGRLTALTGPEGTRWLKEFRGDGAATARKVARIADALGGIVPTVIATDPARGWLLFDDVPTAPFPGDPSLPQVEALLVAYAGIQAGADEVLVTAMPAIDPTRSVGRLLAFLDTLDTTPDGRIGASRFIGRGAASAYSRAIGLCRPALEALLAGAAALPPTLCHGDLRGANVGVDDRDALIFFDWDDAVAGPAGFSLHGLLGGCAGAVVAMLDREDGAVVSALGGYAHVLAEAGYADTGALSEGLPGALVAGVIEHALTFGAYPPFHDETTAQGAATIIGHLEDLLDLCGYLAAKDPPTMAALAVHHAAQGGIDRAAPLVRIFGQGTGAKARADAELAKLSPERAMRARKILGLAVEGNMRRHDAAEPGTVPRVVFAEGDEKDADILGARLSLACDLFREHGVVMIENAFPEALIRKCRETFLAKYADYFVERDHDDAMKVGDKRYMVTVDIEGPFNKAALYASPFVAPVLRRMLGDDLIVGSYNVVTSLPGSGDQWIHKDHPSLFPDAPGLNTPDFAINMIAPLIPMDGHVGTTCVVKGSRFADQPTSEGMEWQIPNVPVGAALLLSYRLTHYGLGNRSQQVRPILSINYHRAWFRDTVNHQKNVPVAITSEELVRVSPDLQHMFGWMRAHP